MIAAALRWGASSWLQFDRLATSLGLFAGAPADSETCGDLLLANLAAPRAKPRRGWKASRSPAGHPVLLAGWIDNLAEIAADLGLAGDRDPAFVYAAAVERWGDAAERRCVGDYVSILARDGSLRLARAPWAAHPLFWAGDEHGVVAASIPRPIFTAGFPKRVTPERHAELLYAIAGSGEDHIYDGMRRVRQGAVVTVEQGRHRTERWYDPMPPAPVQFARDSDYVEAANALLGEAVGAALRPASRPGVLLSGGLDSPIVADEALRQLPPSQRLPSFTFESSSDWRGRAGPGLFANDRPFVEAFAATHPRLEPHFFDSRDTPIDGRMDTLFLAGDSGYRTMMIASLYHGPWQAAADAGCDWLLTGDFGNQTFSNDGRWAYSEFLRRGQWAQLWQMLRDHPGDERSMLRRLVARSLLPQLPTMLRQTLRDLVHGPAPLPLVRRDVAERLDLDARAAEAWGRPREWIASREEFVRQVWRECDGGGENTHAVEQVFGIHLRAVPQYRPLIEFCLAIPTGQFVRSGEMRWLARRMAKGRLPEAQRTNRNYGSHNADWYARLTPRLPDLREELVRLGDDPVMSSIIDIDRALALIDSWPDEDHARSDVHFRPLCAAVIAGRFARYVDGRN